MISIHALREEGDSGSAASKTTRKTFLSTPSARRATPPLPDRSCRREHFYPRPPRGGRHQNTELGRGQHHFYPRPPRGGRQACPQHPPALRQAFLSTPSARRATRRFFHVSENQGISIHALREEGDISMAVRVTKSSHFYPRPPRGGRPLRLAIWFSSNKFLSTPSARRATICANYKYMSRQHFYPRPPRGGRPEFDFSPVRMAMVFLSTPSARRATSCR